MYYAINITKKEDKYVAETYNFSAFTLTDSIFNGWVGLDCAINYNETYPILYEIIEKDTKVDALNAAVRQIDGQMVLSFWCCAFDNGHYSESLTMEIECDSAVLLLPKPLR